MKSNTTWRVNDETRRRDFLGFVAHAPLDASNLIVVFFFVVEKRESRPRVLSFFLAHFSHF